MVHTGKNQIACDPPLTAASLSEWCNEEEKISPSKALTRILEQLMKEQALGDPRADVECTWGTWGKWCPLGHRLCAQVQQTLMSHGSREELSSSRGNLQSATDCPLWRENLSNKMQTLSPQQTQSLWKEQPANKKWLFSLLCRHSQQSSSVPCIVIVRRSNTQIEVWFSRYLARHVDLMWIKGYMVELSKYNQCNMIHSCPAEQMFEQMSGRKKKALGS